MAKDVKTWNVGICCTDSDGVTVYQVTGTRNQVIRHLLKQLKSDKNNMSDTYDYGDETVEAVEENSSENEINAYATYCDFHIDYTAKVAGEPIRLGKTA